MNTKLQLHGDLTKDLETHEPEIRMSIWRHSIYKYVQQKQLNEL